MSLAVALLFAGTANAAACHRFSRWHYPWPQRCGDAHHTYARPAAFNPPVATTDDDHSWYVEITKVPLTWDGDVPSPALTDEERRARDLLRQRQGSQ